jgi:hypothetical protein
MLGSPNRPGQSTAVVLEVAQDSLGDVLDAVSEHLAESEGGEAADDGHGGVP